MASIPPLPSLCITTTTVNSNNNSLPNVLSIKPPPAVKTLHHPDLSLPLPLPDLPSDMKEKILSLELMGVDAGHALAVNPDLHDATPDSIHAVLSYLRSKGIHHHKDLARILGMCPKVLTASVPNDLAPVFAFLSADLCVPDSGFRRAVNKCPRLLVSSVRDQLRPALIYLQRLGFRDLSALAYQDPVLLVSSVQRILIPKLEFLMGLGLQREEAVGLVLRCPSLFTFSIERNFKPKYDYLVSQMSGTLQDVNEFPQYFAFSLEKRIKPRHQAMAEIGVRFSLPEMLKSTDEEFNELLEREKKARV